MKPSVYCDTAPAEQVNCPTFLAISESPSRFYEDLIKSIDLFLGEPMPFVLDLICCYLCII